MHVYVYFACACRSKGGLRGGGEVRECNSSTNGHILGIFEAECFIGGAECFSRGGGG